MTNKRNDKYTLLEITNNCESMIGYTNALNSLISLSRFGVISYEMFKWLNRKLLYKAYINNLEIFSPIEFYFSEHDIESFCKYRK